MRNVSNIIKKNRYSIPIYENDVKTEWTIDGEIGDNIYNRLIDMTLDGKLPDKISINLNRDAYDEYRV